MLTEKSFEAVLTTALVETFGAEYQNLSYSAQLGDYGLDSLQLGNFILSVEDAAGVKIPDDTIDHLWGATTFGEVVGILRGCCATSGSV